MPQSGDYMRLFARTRMTGAATRIAIALAGHISYDGDYRGAPKGFAAFTMDELQNMTDLSRRTVCRALDELADLFGLAIHRRHHDRHLFNFSKLCDATLDDGATPETEQKPSIVTRIIKAATPSPKQVMGHQSPTPLYTRTKSNNHTPSMIEILKGAGSVHETPFASVIETAKRGTGAEAMDAQFLWQGFHLLNSRNEHPAVPLSWLISFVRKAKPRYKAHQTKATVTAKPPVSTDPVTLMAKPARFENRAFHQRDLIKAIGANASENRIQQVVTQYGVTRFAAQRAVHGQAVSQRSIDA
jgi:hypothetical protein